MHGQQLQVHLFHYLMGLTNSMGHGRYGWDIPLQAARTCRWQHLGVHNKLPVIVLSFLAPVVLTP